TTHSISAGLDYPSIGPEHAWLHDTSRAEYVSASDAEALEATTLLARTEGIIPALESAHAISELIKRAPTMRKTDVVVVNGSRRRWACDPAGEPARDSARHDVTAGFAACGGRARALTSWADYLFLSQSGDADGARELRHCRAICGR